MKRGVAFVVLVLVAVGVWLVVRDPGEGPPPAAIDRDSPVAAGDPDAAVADGGSPNRSTEREAIEPAGSDQPVAVETAVDDGATRLIVRVSFQGRDDVAEDIAVRVQSVESQRLAWSERSVVRTDAEGVAAFDAPPVGDVVIATALGGERAARIVEGRSTEIDLVIPRGFTIVGSVVDTRDQPVAGASVWLSEPWRTFRGDTVAETDDAGQFRIESVQFERFVGVRADGYVPSSLQRARADTGSEDVLRFVLVAGGVGRVHGHVVDVSQRSVAGARILVGSDSSSQRKRGADGSWVPGPPPQEARADGTGEFTVAGVPPGTRLLQVRAPGFAPFGAEIEIRADAVVEQRVLLTKEATLAGVVRDPDDAPVAGALVYVRPDDFAGTSARSDDEGSYELGELAAGEVTVTARRADEKTTAQLVIEDGVDHSFDFVLGGASAPSGAPKLVGRVVDEVGEPVRGWRVLVTQAGGVAGRRLSTRTKGDGSFELEVPWETVAVSANPPDAWERFPPVFEPNVSVHAGEVLLRVGANAAGEGVIRGRVVDASGAGRPARVEVWHRELRLYASFDNDPRTGEFELKHVRPGPNQIDVQCRENPWIHIGNRVVEAGQTLDLGNLVVEPAGWVGGTVTLRGAEPPAELRFAVIRDGSEAGVVEYASGRFKSNPLAPAEDYLLVVSGDRVATVTRPFAVTAHRTTELALQFEAAALRVLQFELPPGRARPPWLSIRVVEQGSEKMVWNGGVGPGPELSASVSVSPGSYEVRAHGPSGLLGRYRLQVGSLADASPVRYRIE